MVGLLSYSPPLTFHTCEISGGLMWVYNHLFSNYLLLSQFFKISLVVTAVIGFTFVQNFLSKPQLVTGAIINLRNNNLLASYIDKIVIICSSK